MAQNNPALFDAIMAGGSGGALERWITSQSSVAYDSTVDAVEAFATAVDAAIPTIGGDGPSISQINLLQSIVAGVTANRNLSSTALSDYSDIAGSIAAAFEEASVPLNNVPAIGGGSSAPIQRTYFLDDTFAGTSDGSIAAPFTLVSEFFGEFDAFDFGWQLNLPGALITPDAALPDLNNNSTIVFQGIARDQSAFDLLEIDGQTGNPSFQFRQLAIASLQLTNGTIDLVFEESDVTLLQCAGTLNGTVRLTNCNLVNALFGSDGPPLEMYGGSVTGQLSFSTGKFYDVQFGVFLLMTPGTGTTSLVGCSFAGGEVNNDNNPIIELDPFSAASFETNVTFTGGEKRYSPSVPRVSTVRIIGVNQVAGGGISEFDFGNPESGILAEPDTNTVVQFKVDPGNVALNIMGARVDSGTGHIMILIGNNSGATITLADPLVVSLTFEPRFSP